MKKKFLSLVLVLAMALTLLPTAAFAAEGDVSCPDSSCTDGVVTLTSNPATCTTAGHKGYWTCGTCGKVFANTEGGTPDSTAIADFNASTWTGEGGDGYVPAAGHKTDSASFEKISDTQHAKKCTVCQTVVDETKASHSFGDPTQKSPADATNHEKTCSICSGKVDEAHSYSNGTCACGATQSTDPGTQTTEITSVTIGASSSPVTPGATVTIVVKGAATAGGAVQNAANFFNEGVTNLTWKKNGTDVSPAPEDGKAPAAEGTYTVEANVGLNATGKLSYTLKSGIKGTGTVTVSAGTPETKPTTPTTPTTPDTPKDEDKAPSTNAQGVPVASEVNTAKQANQAIATLKKTDADVMAERVMTNSTAASSFASLDRAVQDAKNIKVSVDVDESSVPSIVRSGVDVVGAALNASASKVALVVDVPSKSYTTSSGYQISMTMTGVSNPAKLAVPVIITLPMPSDVEDGRVVVLHYHDSSSQPDVIIPAVSGRYLRFAVTGFSDFVITDVAAAVGDGSTSGFYTTVQGGKNKNSSNNIEDLLPAIAAMLSGDGVFVDVGKDHWAAKEIRWARNGGVMSGYEGGYFRPTGSTNRQQLWMVLARLSGTRPADMAMARQWAMNTGVSDGTNPTGVLSRQQLLTMLYRYAKSQGVDVSASASLSAYADGAKVASYAKDALSWAAAKGIVDGPSAKLRPEDAATRDYFAVFLYRYSNG